MLDTSNATGKNTRHNPGDFSAKNMSVNARKALCLRGMSAVSRWSPLPGGGFAGIAKNGSRVEVSGRDFQEMLELGVLEDVRPARVR